MKKTFIGISIAGIAVAVVVGAFFFGRTDVAYAQSEWQETPVPGDGFGGGMMGGRGHRGGMMGGQSGVLHDTIVATFAENLGIPVDDLNTRLDGGEAMADIATTEGLTLDEFRTLMVDIRSQAVDQALADGTLTQEQADWMQQRGGGRGMHAGGQGQLSNPDCPYYQTTP